MIMLVEQTHDDEVLGEHVQRAVRVVSRPEIAMALPLRSVDPTGKLPPAIT
jgi:hypothetical protein